MTMTRAVLRAAARAFLAAAVIAATGLAPGLAAEPTATAPGDDATAPLPMQQVADGVWLHRGVHADIAADNHGDIANIGFVIGERCVAVIDTGGSAGVARRLLAALRQRTDKPVCHVVNTHVHPDHMLGNAVFEGPGVQFSGHAALPRALAARGAGYLARARETLPPRDTEGMALVAPQQTVTPGQAGATLDLGGRTLRLRAWPAAHTDNDLTVLDERTGTLWTGDLLFVERIPVVDGRLNGWIAVCDELVTLRPTRVIPGHGPVATDLAAAMAPQRRYLAALRNDVRAAIRGGLTLRRAVDSVTTGRDDGWVLYDEVHRRNVTAAYAELEWEN